MENNQFSIAKKKSLQHIQNKNKCMKIFSIKKMEEIQDLSRQIDF